MSFYLSKKDAGEIMNRLNNRMTEAEEQRSGLKVMCYIIPNNGVRQLGKAMLYVQNQPTDIVDIGVYFDELKMKDFFDFRSCFNENGAQ